ncbi:hypothetical protein N9897_00080 [bacterium]|nr:hypothetical protein [bacterium]MDB4725669.1 hypothetical protein [Akkermansiaceae bacterium]
MNFPLNMSFKILALAPQIRVTDASGNLILYVKQKMFKLKEHVNVFTDEAQQSKFCEITTNKIIDFSASYRFKDAQGNDFGAVRRKGMRSIWKAHYEILQGDDVVFNINEESAWVKVMDSFFSGIPIVGGFSGYVFHPTYLITRTDGTPVIRVKKQPAFLEGKFSIEQIGALGEHEDIRCMMSVLMMTLLERSRG